MFKIILCFIILLHLGCKNSRFESEVTSNNGNTSVAPPESSPDDAQGSPPALAPPAVIAPVAPPVIISPVLNICSKLDFTQVLWPEELSLNEKNYLALGLNITGSFEGHKNWANLSNNFDGMGFSLGIMQQNLGMGSLQPLLIEAMDKVSRGQIEMNSEKFQMMSHMLKQWQRDMALSTQQSDVSELFSENYQYISELDDPQSLQTFAIDYSVNKGSTVINKKSVSWALKDVYIDGGKTFSVDWAKTLNSLALDDEYVAIQIKASYKLYLKALRYFQSFKLTEVRSILTMFDFVVQNGGFKKKVLSDYAAYLKQYPKLTETQKLNKILELRLKDVLPQWQNDVLARKKALINSNGIVHGVKRILNQEYCYDPYDKIITKP